MRKLFVIAAAVATLLATGILTSRSDAMTTGTPAGVGFARKPPRWLRAGDMVTVRIDRIGELRNPVIAET